MIETFGTSRLSRERLTQIVRANFDLTLRMACARCSIWPARSTARPRAYGHFGRTESEVQLEKTDRAEALAARSEGRGGQGRGGRDASLALSGGRARREAAS